MTTIEDLWIDERLSKLCPSLADEELRQLEANVLRDGKFTDPLLYCRIDGNPYLLDGVNRLTEIWNRLPADTHVKPPKLEEVNGIATVYEAQEWILNHQYGRRNMTPEAMKQLRANWVKAIKETPKEENGAGGVSRQNGAKPPAEKKGGRPKSAEALVAEKTNTSKQTVVRSVQWDVAAKRIGMADKEAESDIRNGKLKVKDKDILAAGQLQDDAKVLSAIKEWRKPKPPKPKKERNPKSGTSVSPAKLVDELRRKHVGPLVRGIDAVAKINGGKGPCHQAANDALDKLESALKQMREGQA